MPEPREAREPEGEDRWPSQMACRKTPAVRFIADFEAFKDTLLTCLDLTHMLVCISVSFVHGVFLVMNTFLVGRGFQKNMFAPSQQRFTPKNLHTSRSAVTRPPFTDFCAFLPDSRPTRTRAVLAVLARLSSKSAHSGQMMRSLTFPNDVTHDLVPRSGQMCALDLDHNIPDRTCNPRFGYKVVGRKDIDRGEITQNHTSGCNVSTYS